LKDAQLKGLGSMNVDLELSQEFLIQDRYPQGDLFTCDVADAALKDVMQQMEHPFYSLSKKPETSIRKYEHNGNSIEIVPSIKGLATIYDKDILIYCISQVMHKLERGEDVNKRVRVVSRDLLQFTNRGTGGKDYEALQDAILRLKGTTIKTTVRTGGIVQENYFSLIDTAAIKRSEGTEGRLMWCDIVLSDWVFNAIEAKEVLKLHRDYFRLRRPIEKRIYELARKHCGRQASWKCSLDVLLKKSGSRGEIKSFRRVIKNLSNHSYLPEYNVFYEEFTDMVHFINRGELSPLDDSTVRMIPLLDSSTYEIARSFLPGIDVYAVESEWRIWARDKGPIRQPDKAFLGFCKKKSKKKP